MRVLCINSDWERLGFFAKIWHRIKKSFGLVSHPQYGETYTVRGEEVHYWEGHKIDCYFFVEFPRENAYRKECFIPIQEGEEEEENVEVSEIEKQTA